MYKMHVAWKLWSLNKIVCASDDVFSLLGIPFYYQIMHECPMNLDYNGRNFVLRRSFKLANAVLVNWHIATWLFKRVEMYQFTRILIVSLNLLIHMEFSSVYAEYMYKAFLGIHEANLLQFIQSM